MLKLLDNPQQLDGLGNTPFGCKIVSAAAAYGVGEPVAQFWMQEGGTLLSKMDDVALLEEGARTDWEEIAAFLRTLGLKKFACMEEAARKLKFPAADRGGIMVLHPAPGAAHPNADLVINPGPREIYSILDRSRTENFQPPEFEPFYMDLSFRTRHGAALTAGIRQGERLAACALCTSMTEKTAVISAVACLPELRRRGYASAAVGALAEKLDRENIYIFRADGENEAFYRVLNFLPYGSWTEIAF